MKKKIISKIEIFRFEHEQDIHLYFIIYAVADLITNFSIQFLNIVY